ncbi:Amino acid adenylation [Xenorhabdus vietnamensis]|uniref:Amino acid adenylation n=1 Tax=Xenorhabdus vietnamensis TaxID=351656 RepID=A0A1Y2S892_9GAMM|nr:condensation domain-containing protein [Xenorhabdus vietnamensis]OTA14356.1 Amino acid adenylation [Xenorhabdus vietnamensis]UVN17723.1 Gramicidin S synthase 2 [Xenorhabdus vietnamensis]
MYQNYLISFVGDSSIVVPSTAGLREKWIGAMLDQTGKAYAGALRLDFSPGCVPECVFNAIVDTLIRHPILAAQFDIEDDELVGRAPDKTELRGALWERLNLRHMGITDEMFLAHRARRASDSGLRITSVTDDTGIHVWIGFWTYVCDGASIDLLIEDIVQCYCGKPPRISKSWSEYACMENARISKRVISLQERLEVYSEPGPYGLDAIRETPHGSVGIMQSVRFSSSVLRSVVLAYARACRVTPFVLLFSIFQRAVSVVSRVTTVVTGVPFINRKSPDENVVVGPLSNTVPVTTHHNIPSESLPGMLNQLQRDVIRAAARQDIKAAAFYPDGISPRTVAYELPFPQLFNAWNSRCDGTRIPLGDTEWVDLQLLPNSTCRAGFEITLDEHSEYISGRIDMDVDAYGGCVEQVIKQMIGELETIQNLS